MTRQNHKRGFSLIEAAIVLAVVGGVIGTIWVSAANMYEEYKVSKTVEGVFTTARNIQNLISFRDADEMMDADVTTTELNNTLYNASVFPKDWEFKTYYVKTALNNTLYVYLSPSDGGRFIIRLSAVKKSQCIQLTSQITSAAASTNTYGTGVSRPTLGHIELRDETFTNVFGTRDFPVSPETAAAECPDYGVIGLSFGFTRINN